MLKKDFLNDVKHEINMLKKLATPEELSNLNFDTFNYRSESKCIYGQMTGSCESNRAEELMDASCIRVMNVRGGVNNVEGKTFTEIKSKINGENTGQGWYKSNYRNYSHLSVLEAYISLKDAKNEHIIKYLKGEVETLKL